MEKKNKERRKGVDKTEREKGREEIGNKKCAEETGWGRKKNGGLMKM